MAADYSAILDDIWHELAVERARLDALVRDDVPTDTRYAPAVIRAQVAWLRDSLTHLIGEVIRTAQGCQPDDRKAAPHGR